MQPVRSAKSAYIAAFLLGALIALICVAPAHSSEPASNSPETQDAIARPAS